MAKPKKFEKLVKLQLPGGQATPAPPVGPALGQAGVNIGEFCKKFNDKTKKEAGMIFPVVIYVKKNKSFTFDIKTPPASVLIKKEVGIAKGSGEANKEKVGTITKKQLEKIAKIKEEDLNAYNIEAAMRMIAGTAKNMGITVKG